MFTKRDDNGKLIRHKKAVIDCSKDEVITEQSHVQEVDINNIIKRHGADMIAKTAMLRSQEFQFDDVTGNDFQEAMNKVIKAQDEFDKLPGQIRKEFDYNPAKFLDFIQNPDNTDKMMDMGLIKRPVETPPPEPTPVVITNPETPPPA